MILCPQIKNSKETEYIDISKKFCDIITNIKAQYYLTSQTNTFVSNKKRWINSRYEKDNTNPNTYNNNNINNEMWKEIKNIISQM